VEQVIDVYGESLEDEIKEDLVRFGYSAANLSGEIAFIKSNYREIEVLLPAMGLSWEVLRSHVLRFANEAETLLDNLTRKNLVPEEFAKTLRRMKEKTALDRIVRTDGD